ncbi:PREDICTED: UPF0725 protein At2g20620-like [Camelina sativa]|uniref:UPF0725 protein At2g20620-like n=1 Tax=Camelina sativa TaxID=90675 RepID=A0ABM0ULY8_CAMSA|nr:PREDICTED: UPF0725 protein At2g20620-like [Camelina sativa]
MLKVPGNSPPIEKESFSSDVEDVKGYCGIKAIGCTPADELIGKVGLHCYNSHKGTNLQFLTVTQLFLRAVSHVSYTMTLDAFDPANHSIHSIDTGVWDASHRNGENLRLITTYCIPTGSDESCPQWDPNGVDVLYTGLMPKWLDDDALTGSHKLHFYEVNRSDLQENAWFHLYAQVAAYSKWNIYMVDHLPLETKKVVVQTKEDIESSLKLKSSNAIFYLSFKTRGGAEYKSIIRQTRDGRPQHMCLEVKNVEMDK